MSSLRSVAQCDLTLRSSGPPPARRLARAPASAIIRCAGQAPSRRRPLSSNVRHHIAALPRSREPGNGPTSNARHSDPHFSRAPSTAVPRGYLRLGRHREIHTRRPTLRGFGSTRCQRRLDLDRRFHARPRRARCARDQWLRPSIAQRPSPTGCARKFRQAGAV